MPCSPGGLARFSRAVVCLLALALLFAVTQARLSQYERVFAPTGVMANSVKVAESRFQKQFDKASSYSFCEDAAADEPFTLLAAPPARPLRMATIAATASTHCPLRI